LLEQKTPSREGVFAWEWLLIHKPKIAVIRAAAGCADRCLKHEQFCPLFHHLAGRFSQIIEHLRKTSKSLLL
jgi:hypothetical protein